MKGSAAGGISLLTSQRVSAREVDKIIDKLAIEPSDNLAVVSPNAVMVAAVQMQAKTYTSLPAYVTDMNLYIADAVNRRAQLICLPAFAGLLPLGIVPQAQAQIPQLAPQSEEELIHLHGLHDALSFFSDYTFDAYFYTMASLAARHRVYIMAGTTLYFEENDLCHRAFLFSDEGELVGYQDKVAPTRLEQELQIPPESEVKLFDTRLGPVAILITTDTYYYECARIAGNLGAKILLCPNFFPREYTLVESSLGPNMRAQENQIFAVQSSLVGETGFGFSLEGGGRIFAPNYLLTHKNGVAGKTSGRHEPDVVCLPLNLERLEEKRSVYLASSNPQFLDKYIDRLY